MFKHILKILQQMVKHVFDYSTNIVERENKSPLGSFFYPLPVCSISLLYYHLFANRPTVTGQPDFYCVDRHNNHPEKHPGVRVLSPAKDYLDMYRKPQPNVRTQFFWYLWTLITLGRHNLGMKFNKMFILKAQ